MEPVQRAYYRRLTEDIAPTGWLRFTRLVWNDRSVAFHYGLSYGGRYVFGIPSFDIELSRYSPGEVLLRQVLLSAITEGAEIFDFGVGDEAYKYRFATHVNQLNTWGLYPT
jgi:CelD/BcsL family acetyltransferase involved in cellulose biosynthesis